jgi:hypothetical protein
MSTIIKSGTTTISGATVKGNISYFKDDTTHDLGPTSTTGLYAGVDAPAGGYAIYQTGGPNGVNARVAANDTEAVRIYKSIGATGSTITDVLAWATGQSGHYAQTGPSLYTIGQSALGGIVVYINGGGSSGTSGLIASSVDVGYTQFECQGTAIGGTSAAIGTGYANTLAIIAGCATAGNGARICRAYTGGGYTDWYLPSQNELHRLFINQVAIGATPTAYPSAYMSSTETDATFVWTEDFYGGGQNYSAKSDSFRVRAVRSF